MSISSRSSLIRAAVAALPLLAAHAPAADTPPSRPNVLFIVSDDLNDWIHPLEGYPRVQTPNLDRLAARGMLFTRAYCTAPACNPSRTSVLTGINPSSSGVYHNEQPWRPALPKAITLPAHFKNNSYQVLGRGKVFHEPFEDPAAWHDYIPRGKNPVPSHLPLNGMHAPSPQFDWGPLNIDDNEMDDIKVANWAAEQLRRKVDAPFFLAAGLVSPHMPWYLPKKYFDQYPLSRIVRPLTKDNDLDDVPPIGREMAKPELYHKTVVAAGNWEKGVQAYLAAISFTDTCVGRLLDALDSSGHASNTIIIFWGDNGWHSGEKLHWRKFTLWEESTHIPLIIVAPGITEPGSVCTRTVSLLDIYPTLAELCNTRSPEAIEGHSLVRLLRSPRTPWPYPAVTTNGRNNHAVRTEQWRYIRYCDGTEELYDHRRDPMEWTNLADRDDHDAVKRELKAWLPEVNAPNAPFGEGLLKGRHPGCDSPK